MSLKSDFYLLRIWKEIPAVAAKQEFENYRCRYQLPMMLGTKQQFNLKLWLNFEW